MPANFTGHYKADGIAISIDGFNWIKVDDLTESHITANLDLVARRTNLETDAECVLAAWWNLLTVDKEFLPHWRESKFPGGCAHAGELETSVYLHLAGDQDGQDASSDGIPEHEQAGELASPAEEDATGERATDGGEVLVQ